MTTDSTPRKTLADLLAVMAALRTPETGCPWDLAQTFATIAPYTIEEAYEVADAIARADMPDLKDELGDLLLQVVYHSQIAEEAGHFAFADVADAITRKMIRRHPHVFGSAEERAAGAAPGFWERIKAEERAEKATSPLPVPAEPGFAHDTGRGRGWGEVQTPTEIIGSTPTPAPSPQGGGEALPARAAASLLAGVPIGLPALTRAVKLQDKAARAGFDWPSLAPVFAKMREELAELEEVVAASDETKIAEEFGDLLFVMANVARHLKVDPEAAVRAANQKFTRRFAHIEAALATEGRTPAQSSLEEMDRYWDEAKAIEKQGSRG